ncbi:anti-sigma factor family protein [Occallatibacter riparius]|uniref:Zf-HC2 domain-containing protein n=1 Tax=Occallatibacter riparius TaxID=1002689 RepID=A0A9J7BTG2_9BACT|nr:zf-HC2 domain-containing protein [Occallatibacter riparius]UWZ85936.1 zf-HC2 domain-containing protein [Occallatibacter riparius]
MPERTNIPTSPACGQWETLLADALDGMLRPEDEATFSNHMASCSACTALFEESRRGREWLDFLSVEPEVPAGLLDRILAQTGPGQTAELSVATGEAAVITAGVPLQKRAKSVRVPAWQKPGFMGYVRRFAEPRLMMTAAMAFFSIALTLNMTGVRITKLRFADLKPTSIRMYMQRQITVAYTPIVRYYDHLRLVYEVQSRVREMRRNNDAESQQQKSPQPSGESKQNPNHKDGGSRVDPPQQSVTPALDSVDLLETSLSLHDQSAHSGTTRGHRQSLGNPNGGSGKERRRSSVWTA